MNRVANLNFSTGDKVIEIFFQFEEIVIRKMCSLGEILNG